MPINTQLTKLNIKLRECSIV